ncbi:MAG: magnesium/cobalt transporter CorA [Calditrichaeota bacterium]|nr:magnesium/cobalt transporter CorA [Calditrichota bacterium]
MTHQRMKPHSKKAGLPPGTPIYTDERKIEKVKIEVIDYQKDRFEEYQFKTVEECFPFKNKPSTTWINICGLHDVAVIEKIGEHFEIHPLVVEDIVHLEQRAKMEEFDSYLYFVLRMFSFQDGNFDDEQISIILGKNYVITFQEKSGDVFDVIRERIKSGKNRINREKADYLAYSLIDVIVDNYFVILEKIGEQIEDLEDELLVSPTTKSLHKIHSFKRKILSLRRSVWPLRDVISRFERIESRIVNQSTQIYIRDVYDHTVQIIDTMENYRDILAAMMDIYLSSVSNRMNEIMKVLTIIATIFIPLTFIAGIYGMNFKYMPEVRWHWGYPAALFVMLVIAVIMLVYFRRKKWL